MALRWENANAGVNVMLMKLSSEMHMHYSTRIEIVRAAMVAYITDYGRKAVAKIEKIVS